MNHTTLDSTAGLPLDAPLAPTLEEGFAADATATHVRHPLWLGAMAAPGATTFALLFAIESLARALLVTVIPLQALAILGDAQQVSFLFFAVSLGGLAGTLSVPWLVRRTRRRWIYSLGAALLISAPALLALGDLPAQAAGMALRVFGTACLSICLNLYIMDHISRKDLNASEPKRMFYSAGAWTLGPFLGVYLGSEVAPWAPYALSGLCAVALLAYFWFVRVSDNPALGDSTRPVPGPAANIRRFFSQPRFVLAWAVAIGRNAWWGVLFIYTPIYAVNSGLGELAGGLIVSIGSGFIFIMPLWAWVLRRYGLRRLFMGGFLTIGVMTFAVSLTGMPPLAGAAFLLAAAFGAVAVDAGGNVLFLRAVRQRERSEMTTVYATYRDVADFAPPGIFALILMTFNLSAIFAVMGIAMIGLSHLCRHIPRRM